MLSPKGTILGSLWELVGIAGLRNGTVKRTEAETRSPRLVLDKCVEGLFVIQDAAPNANGLNFTGLLHVVEGAGGDTEVIGGLLSGEELALLGMSNELFAQGLDFLSDLGDERPKVGDSRCFLFCVLFVSVLLRRGIRHAYLVGVRRIFE